MKWLALTAALLFGLTILDNASPSMRVEATPAPAKMIGVTEVTQIFRCSSYFTYMRDSVVEDHEVGLVHQIGSMYAITALTFTPPITVNTEPGLLERHLQGEIELAYTDADRVMKSSGREILERTIEAECGMFTDLVRDTYHGLKEHRHDTSSL